MQHSIRRRLLIILLSTMALVWLVTATTSFIETRHEISELFDAQLAQSAHTLRALAAHEIEELGQMDEGLKFHLQEIVDDFNHQEGHKYERLIALQIWAPKSQELLLRSLSAPPTLLSNERGYTDRVINNKSWRIFSLEDPETKFMILVGQSYAIRNELINAVAQQHIVPMLLAFPLMAFFIWAGISRALKPLIRLTSEVGNRAPTNLTPIRLTGVPEETRSLVRAINKLFERLQNAFANERRFTADAAHELRTPLAALKTQAQVAQRATDKEQRIKSLDQMLVGVDRTSRLLEQLLTLARVDPETDLRQEEQVDLCLLAAEVMAELAPSAIEKNIELTLEENFKSMVNGHGDSLHILLRNLIDNAIRYTPEGGSVEVTINTHNNSVQLMVADSGTGIPEEERERIFERFYRRTGTKATGSGLGLSIVKRIADLHRAEIQLADSPLGGLCFILQFPAVYPPNHSSNHGN